MNTKTLVVGQNEAYINRLVVGQDVFMHGPLGSVWGKVIEFTPPGVTVQRDPFYGGDLLQFDKNGNSVGPEKLRLYLSPVEAGIARVNGKLIPGEDRT